jgi:hypothetical protein
MFPHDHITLHLAMFPLTTPPSTSNRRSDANIFIHVFLLLSEVKDAL